MVSVKNISEIRKSMKTANCYVEIELINDNISSETNYEAPQDHSSQGCGKVYRTSIQVNLDDVLIIHNSSSILVEYFIS